MFSSQNVISLKNINRDNAEATGIVAAEYGEMMEEGIPLAPGFVISQIAFEKFYSSNNLRLKIKHLLETVNFNHEDSIAQVCLHIKKMILSSPVPHDVISDITKAYTGLGESSIKITLCEGKETAQPMFLKGDANLLVAVKQLWALPYEKKALLKRLENKENQLSKLSIIVQLKTDTDISGLIFTTDPATQNKNRIIIEIKTDNDKNQKSQRYEIDKKDLSIVLKSASKKEALSHDLIRSLCLIAKKVEKLYYFPKQIVFDIQKGKIYVNNVSDLKSIPKDSISLHNPFILGLPVYPGIVSATAVKVSDVKDIKKVKSSDIVILPSADISFLPVLKKAGGVIIEGTPGKSFGMSARAKGIPSMSHAKQASKLIKERELITLNATKGEVFKGGFFIQAAKKSTALASSNTFTKTATRIYGSLNSLFPLNNLLDKQIEGVFFDPSFLLKEFNLHPKSLFEKNHGKRFFNLLFSSLSKAMEFFYPLNVVYKFIDMPTDEFRKLVFGNDFEVMEDNPFLGFHGSLRYIYDNDFFKLQTDVIAKLHKQGQKNLQLLLPFVRTPLEAKVLKERLSGFKTSLNLLKLWFEIVTPASCLELEPFLKQKPYGILFSPHAINMLLMGLDSEKIQSYAMGNPLFSVLKKAFSLLNATEIKTCIDTSSLVLDAKTAGGFVKLGPTAMSCPFSNLSLLKEEIAKAEKKLLA